MIVFTLDNDQEVSVKTNAHEYTYSEFIDFQEKEIPFWNAVEVNDPNADKLLVECVKQFHHEDLDSIDTRIIGDDLHTMIKSGWLIDYECDAISVERLYVNYVNTMQFFFRNEIEPHLKNIDSLGLSDSDKSEIKQMYETLINACDTFTMERAALAFAEKSGLITLGKKVFGFTYKGSNYEIRAEQIGKHFLGQFTAGEVKEVLEHRRLNSDTISDRSQFNGMLAFKIGLRDLATLCRRKGERLPKNEAHRKMLLNQRMFEFQKMPMNIICLVRFFFILTLAEYTEAVCLATSTLASPEVSRTASTTLRGIGLKVKHRREVNQYGMR